MIPKPAPLPTYALTNDPQSFQLELARIFPTKTHRNTFLLQKVSLYFVLYFQCLTQSEYCRPPGVFLIIAHSELTVCGKLPGYQALC